MADRSDQPRGPWRPAPASGGLEEPMAPQPHPIASPPGPALPPHRQFGFPTEEDMLDWLENQPATGALPPRHDTRRRSALAWVGVATAAVAGTLARRGRRPARCQTRGPVDD